MRLHIVTAHIEARVLEQAPAARVGHEQGVLAVLDDEYRRRFLALEGPRRRHGRVSLVRGSALNDRYPVLAEQGDAGAG